MIYYFLDEKKHIAKEYQLQKRKFRTKTGLCSSFSKIEILFQVQTALICPTKTL